MNGELSAITQGQMEMENACLEETQLDLIRELMLAAASRGLWLTLEEIAEQTEFGEASISAQLRHLRKPRHGRFRVEKRRRFAVQQTAGATPTECSSCIWEYQVSPQY
jgi:hypothetical protein